MLTTNQKGAVAEAAITHAALELGVGVSKPHGDESYDLIFDLRPQLVPFSASRRCARATSS